MEATGETMRKWKCALCQGKELTLMIDFKNRLVIKCETCKDSQWVKR